MERVFYDYDTFVKDMVELAHRIDEPFDAIVAIARGGMTMAHMLAEFRNLRNVFVINAIGYEDTKKLGEPKIFNIPDLTGLKRVLIVDDIADSGGTLKKVTEALKKSYPDIVFKTATLFYKPEAAFQPDYRLKKADRWIDFFWSEDMKRYNSYNNGKAH
jgi:xanthine phosphoribosyltransferase